MSKRVKNWTTETTKFEQMFQVINSEVLIEMNNRLAFIIKTLEAEKQNDFGDIFDNPDDYDETDRKEYFALCRSINKRRAELKKLHLHMSGLAEMITDYTKEKD